MDIVIEDYQFLQHHGYNSKKGDQIHIGWLLICTVAHTEKILINLSEDLSKKILTHIEKRFEKVSLILILIW